MYHTNLTMQKGKENGKSGDETIETKQRNASAQKAQMIVVQRILKEEQEDSEPRSKAFCDQKEKTNQRRASYQAPVNVEK